jgi:hypothetical protein
MRNDNKNGQKAWNFLTSWVTQVLTKTLLYEVSTSQLILLCIIRHSFREVSSQERLFCLASFDSRTLCHSQCLVSWCKKVKLSL